MCYMSVQSKVCLFVVCLIKTGIRGKVLDIIRSIIQKLNHQVKHNNIISPVFLATYVSDMEIAYHHSFLLFI